MALGANSYGDTAEIAALTPRYANGSGAFDASTTPKLTQVESETDQVSAILNVVLAELGFTIPVTQADAKLMLDWFVNHEVAAIVEGINGNGRFGPSQHSPGGKQTIIEKEVRDFVTRYATGIERLGAGRNYSATSGLGYRDTDNSGDATFPLFQREGFGATFEDWDR